MKVRRWLIILMAVFLCIYSGISLYSGPGLFFIKSAKEKTEVSETAAKDEPAETAEYADGDELPDAYDGRLADRVSEVQNQGSLGTCWAFASLMALESSLMPEEQWNFSEDHMSLNNGFSISQESGGEFTMSMAYLLSWKGPVTEEEDPYGDGISPDGLKAVKHVQEIQFVPAKDYKKIKLAVLQYGGVQSSLYTSMTEEYRESDYYNKSRYAYCYVGSEAPNHDSVIIGWDDNYPKENFNTPVNGDGAFICTNSWGDGFGELGYYYVSYYDSNIGMNNMIYTSVEPPDNYDHIYQSDMRGWVGQIGYGMETAWFSSVYKAGSSQELKSVGFYAAGRHTSYEVYVVRHADEETVIINEGGLEDRIPAAKGTMDYSGYYTVNLEGENGEGFYLDPGERFAVMVKITTPDAIHPVAIEYDAKDVRTTVDITDGEGYISPDGIAWERVEKKQNCNLCLKAYTADR